MKEVCVLERNSLYLEVWAKPALQVAKDIGISSVALKKICSAMAIPTPPRGYWMKSIERRRGLHQNLKPPGPGLRIRWTVDVAKAKQQSEEAQKRQISIPDNSDIPIIPIADKRTNLCGLVKATLVQFREDRRGAQPQPHRDRRRLDMRVFSESLVKRAALFLDAFVRNIEARGLTIDYSRGIAPIGGMNYCPYNKDRGKICWVEAYGEPIGIVLREPDRRIMTPRFRETRRGRIPIRTQVRSGELEFVVAGGVRRWRDKPDSLLEEHLEEIIGSIGPVGKILAERRAINEQKDAERQQRQAQREEENRLRMEARRPIDEENARKRREFERRRLIETEAKSQLMAQLEDFNRSLSLRRYVTATREAVGNLSPEASAWCDWVENEAKDLDPLSSNTPPWESLEFLNLLAINE